MMRDDITISFHRPNLTMLRVCLLAFVSQRPSKLPAQIKVDAPKETQFWIPMQAQRTFILNYGRLTIKQRRLRRSAAG